uniref:Uncharacterized protein n=1 Tax=Babesia bovis TaxID=5865 RepID=S6B5L4_BABBO|nr:hypothetical protein [Babesia bovis]
MELHPHGYEHEQKHSRRLGNQCYQRHFGNNHHTKYCTNSEPRERRPPHLDGTQEGMVLCCCHATPCRHARTKGRDPHKYQEHRTSIQK